jgi:hypothetical protein
MKLITNFKQCLLNLPQNTAYVIGQRFPISMPHWMIWKCAKIKIYLSLAASRMIFRMADGVLYVFPWSV